MNKEEFLEVFQQMLVAAFEMQAASEVLNTEEVVVAATRLHSLGGYLSPSCMEIVTGVLIAQWAIYVSQDSNFMHPEEAIDLMITKLDRILQ